MQRGARRLIPQSRLDMLSSTGVSIGHPRLVAAWLVLLVQDFARRRESGIEGTYSVAVRIAGALAWAGVGILGVLLLTALPALVLPGELANSYAERFFLP